MRVLLVGAGTVGEAIAKVAADRDWLEHMLVTDYDLDRAQVRRRLDQPRRQVRGASDRCLVRGARRARGQGPRHRPGHERGRPAVRAAHLRRRARGRRQLHGHGHEPLQPHPEAPFDKPGLKLGDEQFEQAQAWERPGSLALLGMGMDPGLSDVFAAYAVKHLFDDGGVDEVHIRDGGDLAIPGYAFAPCFRSGRRSKSASTRPSSGKTATGTPLPALQRAGDVPLS